jgi:hypothetical protein
VDLPGNRLVECVLPGKMTQPLYACLRRRCDGLHLSVQAPSFDLMLESPRIRTPALSPRGALPLGPAAPTHPQSNPPHFTPTPYATLGVAQTTPTLLHSPFEALRDKVDISADDVPVTAGTVGRPSPKAVKLATVQHQTSLGMEAVPDTPSLCAEVRMGCCPSSSYGVPDSARSDAVGGAFARGPHDVPVSPEPVVVA